MMLQLKTPASVNSAGYIIKINIFIQVSLKVKCCTTFGVQHSFIFAASLQSNTFTQQEHRRKDKRTATITNDIIMMYELYIITNNSELQRQKLKFCVLKNKSKHY